MSRRIVVHVPATAGLWTSCCCVLLIIHYIQTTVLGMVSFQIWSMKEIHSPPWGPRLAWATISEQLSGVWSPHRDMFLSFCVLSGQQWSEAVEQTLVRPHWQISLLLQRFVSFFLCLWPPTYDSNSRDQITIPSIYIFIAQKIKQHLIKFHWFFFCTLYKIVSLNVKWETADLIKVKGQVHCDHTNTWDLLAGACTLMSEWLYFTLKQHING